MSSDRVFGEATRKTHMPFLAGEDLLFCVSDGIQRHEAKCGGEIWRAMARRAELRSRLGELPKSRPIAYRPWKLAHCLPPDGPLRRIETGLPAEAVGCNPAFYRENGTWHVSFVGGLPTVRGWSYHLYAMRGPSPAHLGRAEKVVPQPVRVGFLSPRYLCTGGRRRLDLTDRGAGETFSLEFPFEQMLRASFRADDPQTLIVSGVDDSGRDATLVYRIDTGAALEIISPADAYKPSLYGDRLIFAKRRGETIESRELWEGPLKLTPSPLSIHRSNGPSKTKRADAPISKP